MYTVVAAVRVSTQLCIGKMSDLSKLGSVGAPEMRIECMRNIGVTESEEAYRACGEIFREYSGDGAQTFTDKSGAVTITTLREHFH